MRYCIIVEEAKSYIRILDASIQHFSFPVSRILDRLEERTEAAR